MTLPKFSRPLDVIDLALASVNAGSPLVVQSIASRITRILLRAADIALTELAGENGFAGDASIWITVPEPIRKALAQPWMADRANFADHIRQSLNAAAGAVAGEAKPVFYAAIDRMKIANNADLIHKSNGGTRCLRESASNDLVMALRPLVAMALDKSGVYAPLDALGDANVLSGIGITRLSLIDNVCEQILSGILARIGREEMRLRGDVA